MALIFLILYLETSGSDGKTNETEDSILDKVKKLTHMSMPILDYILICGKILV